jgi:phosphopantothenate synthetase
MYTHDYHDHGRLLLLRGSGVMTGPELIATTRRVVEDEEAARRVDTVLVLLEDITRLEVSADDVRQVVEIDRRMVQLIPRARVAIVAPKDEVYGMSRMWEMMVEFTGWDTRVSRTRPEADAWLAEARKPGM